MIVTNKIHHVRIASEQDVGTIAIPKLQFSGGFQYGQYAEENTFYDYPSPMNLVCKMSFPIKLPENYRHPPHLRHLPDGTGQP